MFSNPYKSLYSSTTKLHVTQKPQPANESRKTGRKENVKIARADFNIAAQKRFVTAPVLW